MAASLSVCPMSPKGPGSYRARSSAHLHPPRLRGAPLTPIGPSPDGSLTPRASVCGLPGPAEPPPYKGLPWSSLPSSRSADGRGPTRLDSGGLRSGPGESFPGNPQPALRGLSLDCCQGQITALPGHNGDGKATMLWAVATVLISPRPQLARLLNGRGVWGLHREVGTPHPLGVHGG